MRKSLASGTSRLSQAIIVPLAVLASHLSLAATLAPGPTVRDVVEFTRIVHPDNQNDDLLQRQISPDGSRAFIVTRRGFVQRDQTRYEVLLFDLGQAASASDQAAAPRSVLAFDASQDNDFAFPFITEPRWVGNRTIAFIARVHDAAPQVFRLDVDSRRLTQLSFAPDGVASFAISEDLRRVVYSAVVPNPPMSEGARSLVVENKSFWSVKFGQNDVRSQQRYYRFYVTDSGSRRPARQLGDSIPEISAWPRVSISPDGQWALIPVPAPERQVDWAREYPLVSQLSAAYGPALTVDPLGYFTRPAGWTPRRLMAYRLSDGHAQVVADAPDDAEPGLPQSRSDRLWQRGGKSFVFAGTLLPAAIRPVGSRPDASYIVEYWPAQRRMRVVAALKGRLENAYPQGDGDSFVAIDSGVRRRFERRRDASWAELDGTAATNRPSDAQDRSVLRIEQTLNSPPDLVMVSPTGRVRRLTNLNPGATGSAWGSIQPYRWKDSTGKEWRGGLMTPGDFDPRKKYPLVIQTYGFSDSRFYLDGSNYGDGATSGFAGRAFMREKILVLALPIKPENAAKADHHEELVQFANAVRGAARALVQEGVVDPERIGIMGWSMTGEHVLNAITFGDVPIRAATLLDGDANTMFSMAVTYAANDSLQVRKERINEGAPFGSTLANWVRNDPALHTDCIKAAVRVETYGPWVLNNWDIYALLRRQYKPAEMIVIPGGTHALARPSERMISLQGNVDWFRFWLKDEVRTHVELATETEESLAQQYARWRQMAELKRRDEPKPREGCSWAESASPTMTAK